MSDKLSAAIEVLQEDDLCRFGIYGSETDYQKVESILAAIRLLEAAGKVDKERCVLAIDAIDGSPRGWGGLDEQRHQIRTLLAALPEEKAIKEYEED